MCRKEGTRLPRRLTPESPGSHSWSLPRWCHGVAAVKSRGNQVLRLFRPYFQVSGWFLSTPLCVNRCPEGLLGDSSKPGVIPMPHTSPVPTDRELRARHRDQRMESCRGCQPAALAIAFSFQKKDVPNVLRGPGHVHVTGREGRLAGGVALALRAVAMPALLLVAPFREEKLDFSHGLLLLHRYWVTSGTMR